MNGRNTEIVRFGPFRFDPADGLRRGEQEVPLPPRALALLGTLLARPGAVVPKRELLDAVWGDTFVTEASLLEAIGVLRRALGDDRHAPTYVQTVHRRGYRFVAAIVEARSAGIGAPDIGCGETRDRRAERTGPDVGRAADWTGASRRFFSGPEWRPIVAACATALVATTALAIAIAAIDPRSRVATTSRVSIALPDDTFVDLMRGSVAVSPDGRLVAFVAVRSGRARLFLRAIDRDEPMALDGTDGAADPFFSPDGSAVGFFADGSLKRVSVRGGPPAVLCAARPGAGATWSDDGTITFGGAGGGGLARVRDTGGDAVVIAAPQPSSIDVRFIWPDTLPGGRAIVYTAVTLVGSDIALLNLRTGRHRTLIRSAAFARYSPTGHLVFERDNRLEAVAFSAVRGAVDGDPQTLIARVATSATLDGAQFAFSRSGSLVYVPGRMGDGDLVQWMDRDGRLEPLPMPPLPATDLALAPDRQRLALTVRGDAGPDMWIGDLGSGSFRRLPQTSGALRPTWRPDGLEIAFAASKAGPFTLFVRTADDAAPARALTGGPWNQVPSSWSPDGRLLAFTEFHPRTGADIWTVELASTRRQPLVRSAFDDADARFSPDGRWVAYTSNETGRWEVYVRDTRGAGPRVHVSESGGVWPEWSSDGRTLYFSANGRAAAARVRSSQEFSVFPPVTLPLTAAVRPIGAADRDRVLVRRMGPVPARHELRLVIGWFAELARLVREPA